MDLFGDLVCLITFFDALQTRRACEFLEEDGIGFKVRDHSVRVQGVSRFQESPAILMEIFVNADDVHRAQSCLRRTMQLFPERELDPQSWEATDDNEVLSEAFACDAVDDARGVSEALHSAGIWSAVRQDVEADDDPIYMVEVKGQDIERAMDVVNQWLSLKKMR